MASSTASELSVRVAESATACALDDLAKVRGLELSRMLMALLRNVFGASDSTRAMAWFPRARAIEVEDRRSL